MTAPHDRRQAPRYVVSVEITFDSEHNLFTGLTHDLSRGGVFVATTTLCRIGERVQVKLKLPTSPVPIEVLTEVRWVRTRDVPGDGGKAGLGLMFLQMSPQAKQAVLAFLDKRESIFFDAD
jgi:uncharacterized protein (TIGR02266 family)